MNHKKILGQSFGLMLVLVLLVGCNVPATTQLPLPSTEVAVPATITPEPTDFHPSVAVIGDEELVFLFATDRCADSEHPDLPVRAFRDTDGMIQMSIPSPTNYRLIGADLESLEPDCIPVFESARDRNPAHYSTESWLGATYTLDGKTIYAIVHNEYHGDQVGSVWQADGDLNSKQGEQNWYYQSWNGTSYIDMNYDASSERWQGSQSLCQIGGQWAHPDLSCEPSRKWISPLTGTVTISGQAYDLDPNGGNGVVSRILKGSDELWSATIENGDSTGQSFNLEVSVQEGDEIYFKVSALGNTNNDTTYFNPGINIGPAPCPSFQHNVCTLISLTYAISTDGGKTYTQPQTPDHLIANFPYQYDPDVMRAIWQPSNIVKNPRDGYYYVLIQLDEHIPESSSHVQGTCVMRTQTLDDPTSWRAWDGNGFNMRFINPYIETDTDPKEHTCELVSPENGALTYGLNYSTFFEKFIAVGVSGWPTPGFYFSLSDDLIHWTPKQLIMEAPQSFTTGGQTPYFAYPSLIDPDDPSVNFDSTGQSPYLYFSRFNSLSPMLDIDLLRVRIEFSKELGQQQETDNDASEERVEPVTISISQQELTVSANKPIDLAFAWEAMTDEQVADFLANAQFDVSIDGDFLPDTMDYWGDIENSGNGNYLSRWQYPLGILAPGPHQVEFKLALTEPVTDGLGNEYSGVIFESMLQIDIGD